MLILSDIEHIERDAENDYVDAQGVGGYHYDITKLCADWREMRSALDDINRMCENEVGYARLNRHTQAVLRGYDAYAEGKENFSVQKRKA